MVYAMASSGTARCVERTLRIEILPWGAFYAPNEIEIPAMWALRHTGHTWIEADIRKNVPLTRAIDC